MAVMTDLKEKFLGIFDETEIENKAVIAKEAIRLLEELSIPNTKNEEWKYTPVAKFLDKNYQLGRVSEQVNLPQIPIDAHLLTFVNGFFVEKLSSFSDDTLIFSSEVLPNGEDLEDDFFVCLNVAFATQGAKISVPKNYRCEKPIWIRSINLTQEAAIFSQLNHQIELGENSELTLIEESFTLGENHGFQNILTTGKIAANAKLLHYKVQNDNALGHQVNRSNFILENDARIEDFVFSIGKGFVRNNLDMKLSSNNEAYMYGLTILTDKAFADHHTVADHRFPHSYSNELYKGVFADSSHGVFNGKVFVRPQAQKTNAFQSNRNILLSDKARIDTKPQLEIFADDVKCSHGATTGKLDKDALFYLRARGVPFEQARTLLLQAFAAEVTEKIKHESLKTYIQNCIEKLI